MDAARGAPVQWEGPWRLPTRSQQVEHQERRAEQAEQRLARSIRRLHGLREDAAAIAAALSVDVEQVRRVLSA